MRRIRLSEGGGGDETWRLIKELFVKHFDNSTLALLEDSAILSVPSRIAFTTDAFTVKPVFFRGGNIGKLAVAGTVNDLAVMGARPLYLSVSFILEEGLLYQDLERVVESLAQTAREVGAKVVAGDTKVVPAGQADGLFISASGVGEVLCEGLSARNIKDGDAILVSGPIGEHGACVLAEREGFDFGEDFGSDCMPLWDLVEFLLGSGVDVHAMRDPTRGGLSAVLHEWAMASGHSFIIEEYRVPVKREVLGICEFLGLEPYHLACEGRVLISVRAEDAERALEVLKSHPNGREASIIAYAVRADRKPTVVLRTLYHVERLLEPPAGELLPRIC